MVSANQHIDKPGSEFWKRVKFSMHKDDLERCIREIDAIVEKYIAINKTDLFLIQEYDKLY